MIRRLIQVNVKSGRPAHFSFRGGGDLHRTSLGLLPKLGGAVWHRLFL
jgi:hypothetical protein